MSASTITLPSAITSAVATYLAAVNAPGAFQAVEWRSSVKPAAAHRTATLQKVTRATVRTGVQYANLGVNDGVDTGALPWGEWAVFPYVITHKGIDYARLYIALKACPTCEGEGFSGVAPDGALVTCKRCRGEGSVPVSMATTYYVDGVEVSRDVFAAYLTPSAREASRPVGGTVTVKLANLTLLGKAGA